MPHKQPPAAHSRAEPVAMTVTCMHCRYERPAADKRCHICGYPWPWLKTTASRPAKVIRKRRKGSSGK